MNLRDVTDRTATFWRALGNKAVRFLKDQSAAGRSFDGTAFPAYSETYLERKSAGKFKRQASTSSRPDLRLTGDMMRDLKTGAVTNKGVDLGWSAYGDRAAWNAENGRAVIDFDAVSDPHPRLSEMVLEACAIDTEEKLNKWASVPLDIYIKK